MLCSTHLTYPLGCLQTKTVNTPIAPARSCAKPNAWGSAALPAAAVQLEARQDSNTDVLSQASGDAASVVSKTEEPARASSVSADNEPETSGTHSSAAPQDKPHNRSRVQVSAAFRTIAWSIVDECWFSITANTCYKELALLKFCVGLLYDQHPEARQYVSHMCTGTASTAIRPPKR